MPRSTRDDDDPLRDELPGLTERTHRVSYGAFREEKRRQGELDEPDWPALLDGPDWSSMNRDELAALVRQRDGNAPARLADAPPAGLGVSLPATRRAPRSARRRRPS